MNVVETIKYQLYFLTAMGNLSGVTQGQMGAVSSSLNTGGINRPSD